MVDALGEKEQEEKESFMGSNGKEARSAVLIRCTVKEAEAIRKAAKLERRTVSSYVLRAVMNRMNVQRRVELAQNMRQGEQREASSGDGAAMIS